VIDLRLDFYSTKFIPLMREVEAGDPNSQYLMVEASAVFSCLRWGQFSSCLPFSTVINVSSVCFWCSSCILGEPTIEEYYNVALEAEKLGDRIQEAVMQSRAAQQSLVPGRVVVVKTPIVSN
jgi:hypothetical protein